MREVGRGWMSELNMQYETRHQPRSSWFQRPPSPRPSPPGEGEPDAASRENLRLVGGILDRNAKSERRRFPLLGERARVRASVNHSFDALLSKATRKREHAAWAGTGWSETALRKHALVKNGRAGVGYARFTQRTFWRLNRHERETHPPTGTRLQPD